LTPALITTDQLTGWRIARTVLVDRDGVVGRHRTQQECTEANWDEGAGFSGRS
jgi:hypothetical protein